MGVGLVVVGLVREDGGRVVDEGLATLSTAAATLAGEFAVELFVDGVKSIWRVLPAECGVDAACKMSSTCCPLAGVGDAPSVCNGAKAAFLSD